MRDNFTTSDLVKHMQRFYSDRSIIEDLDGVRYCCRNAAEVAVVEAYAKARKSSPGFKAHSYRHNNHDQIPPEVLEEVLLAGTVQIQCPYCLGYFVPVDGRRRFCSETCRAGGRTPSGRPAPGLSRPLAAEKPRSRRPGTRGPGKGKSTRTAPLRAAT